MNSQLKKNIAIIILASFLMLVLFSFGAVVHESGNQMSGDCPFSSVGSTICPQDVLSVALHHVSAYSSFFNVPLSFGPTTLSISMLSVLTALFVVSTLTLLPKQWVSAYVLYNTPPATTYNKTITRWLSLFENSPSSV